VRIWWRRETNVNRWKKLKILVPNRSVDIETLWDWSTGATLSLQLSDFDTRLTITSCSFLFWEGKNGARLGFVNGPASELCGSCNAPRVYVWVLFKNQQWHYLIPKPKRFLQFYKQVEVSGFEPKLTFERCCVVNLLRMTCPRDRTSIVAALLWWSPCFTCIVCLGFVCAWFLDREHLPLDLYQSRGYLVTIPQHTGVSWRKRLEGRGHVGLLQTNGFYDTHFLKLEWSRRAAPKASSS